MKKLLILIISFIFLGCGYKPTSYYTKNEISGYVFVKLGININSTQGSVLVKDAINEMIVHKFKSSLTNDITKANTVIDISLGSVGHSVLQTDDKGYASLYRTTASVVLRYYNVKNNIPKSVSTTSSYDYAIDENSIITDDKKTYAIKIATKSALEDIFSNIAVQNFDKK
jgi:hypothetical protein